MRFAVALTLISLLSGGAIAQEARLDRVDVDEYGIYGGKTESAVPAPDSPAGKIERLDQMHLSASTRAIPGQRGVRFGYHFKVVGSPPGAVVPLRMVTIFPGGGLRDPKAQQAQRQSEYVAGVPIGEGRYGGYTMSEDWEVVPGIWTFQIWYGDKKMAEQHFMVTKK